jgi:hypothetical protein
MVPFILFNLSPALCIAIVTITVSPFRKQPGFVPLFNFKRPIWLALFISVGMVVVGLCGAMLTPRLFRFWGIPYEKLGSQDIATIGFTLLMPFGALCSVGCLVVWLRHLIIAIRLYSQAKQNRKNINSII